jgi:hypothetical protein
MVRTFGYSVFLLFVALCAVQLMGTASADEFLDQWSTGPLHAHEQLPGTADGQPETDQGEGELEELALAQEDAFRIIHLARACILDSASCPRADFASDLFRPPTLS